MDEIGREIFKREIEENAKGDGTREDKRKLRVIKEMLGERKKVFEIKIKNAWKMKKR